MCSALVFVSAEPARAGPPPCQVASSLPFSTLVDVPPPQPAATFSVFELRGGKARPFVPEPVYQSKSTPAHETVDEAKVEALLRQASALREKALRRPRRVKRGDPLMPEDGSARLTSVFVRFRTGAGGEGLYKDKPADAMLVAMLAAIGRHEGFETVVLVRPDEEKKLDLGSLSEEERANVRTATTDTLTWLEDNVEFTVKGQVRSPPLGQDADLRYRAVHEDRVRRFYGERARADIAKQTGVDFTQTLEAKYPKALSLKMLGASHNRKDAARVAALVRGGLRKNLTYFDGGNLLSGRHDDGTPYAIVGHDTIAAIRAQLGRELARAVSTREARRLLAKDLGVKPRHLHAVEQPGAFHLDMAMVAVRGKQIILNDAVAAAKLESAWERADTLARKPKPIDPNADDAAKAKYERAMKNWGYSVSALESSADARLREAKARGGFEDQAQKDLERAGFKVHRIAGVFGEMNFINAELGTGRDGARYWMTLGGSARAQEHFARELARVAPDAARRIYFLDPRITGSNLGYDGGLSCRIKARGRLVCE